MALSRTGGDGPVSGSVLVDRGGSGRGALPDARRYGLLVATTVLAIAGTFTAYTKEGLAKVLAKGVKPDDLGLVSGFPPRPAPAPARA